MSQAAAYDAGYMWVTDSAYQPMDWSGSVYDIRKFPGQEKAWNEGRMKALLNQNIGGKSRKRRTRKSKRRKSYKRRR